MTVVRTQRGLAAVTALLIVAVAASAAALMLSQQSAMLDQTLMVAARAQADLYAQAGVEWARGVLAEDVRQAKDIDSLDEGWAQPIAALPVERALVAGAIEDEQGKFNLNNVAPGGQRSDPDLRILRSLLGSLDLSPDLADAVLDWIDADSDLAGNGGAENSYYLSLARPYRAANREMVQVEELYRVRGFDAAAVARLKPYVTALPGRTAINVNTASPVVLAAVFGVARESAAAALSTRRGHPFRAASELVQRMKAGSAPANALDVKSALFRVRVQVSQDDVHLATEALVRRADSGATDIIWRRPLY